MKFISTFLEEHSVTDVRFYREVIITLLLLLAVLVNEIIEYIKRKKK